MRSEKDLNFKGFFHSRLFTFTCKSRFSFCRVRASFKPSHLRNFMPSLLFKTRSLVAFIRSHNVAYPLLTFTFTFHNKMWYNLSIFFLHSQHNIVFLLSTCNAQIKFIHWDSTCVWNAIWQSQDFIAFSSVHCVAVWLLRVHSWTEHVYNFVASTCCYLFIYLDLVFAHFGRFWMNWNFGIWWMEYIMRHYRASKHSQWLVFMLDLE